MADNPSQSTACRITHLPSGIVVESHDKSTKFENWLNALTLIATEALLQGIPVPTAKELEVEYFNGR